MLKENNFVIAKRTIVSLIFSLLLVQPAAAQKFSLEACVEILDSLYYENEPGDLSDLKESSLFHIVNSNDSIQVIRLIEYWSYVHENLFQYDSALVYYGEAFDGYLKLGDSLMAAHMLYGEASMQTELQEYVLSTRRYLQALRFYQSYGSEEDIADTYNAMANNYFYAGDEMFAIRYYQKARTHYETTTDIEQYALILTNMAGAYSQIERYDSAYFYYKKALTLLSGTDYIDALMGVYHGIGSTKEITGSYDDAYYYYQRAHFLAKTQNRKDQLGYSYQHLAYYFLSQNIFDSALYYGLKAEAIAKTTDLYILQYNSFDLLHQVFEGLGDFKKAYGYLSMLKTEDDSTFSLNKSRQINILLKEYESEIAERKLLSNDIELLTFEQASQKEQALRTILIVALIAMFTIAMLAVRNERVKARSNKLLQRKNDEILAKNHQIKKIEEAKSKWFINVSHELRTPLSLVKGPLQQIGRVEKLQKASLSLLNIANRNVLHLEQLIKEILDLSKLEDGKIVLHTEVFDFSSTIKQWLEPFTEQMRQRKLTWEIAPIKEDKLFVKLDKKQFNKVFNNLIRNAIKFSEHGGNVRVGFHQVGKDLVMEVSDQGIGIPKNDLPNVFDRFYQASNSTQNQESGTGVGLSMSREIVELHKGVINVKSQLGDGTTVTVSIPDAVLDTEVSTEGAQNGDQVKYLASKILLVEDNPDMQNFVQTFLDNRFNVIRKSNAQDALESLESSKSDLIITDLMMPKIDGFQFIQKIKNNPEWSHIPIIVITAISDENKRLSLLRMGVNDYMVKPFNPEELTIKVDNLLEQHVSNGAVSHADEQEDISFEDRLVKDLEEKVRAHISDPDFNVVSLAEDASLSERQLYRYLRQTVKMTPANFIKEIRLSRAFELARKNVYATTAELSYAVGFQHPSYFTTVFKKRFGKKPSDFMKEKSA